MNVLEYKSRIIDNKIKEYLKIFGAILIEGPKWCGKTWTSKYNSNSEFLVASPKGNFNNKKYYIVDVVLKYALLGTRVYDVGHRLENVIYLELIRRGYKVYIGKINDLEVDFVAMLDNNVYYFQAAATVRDNKTLEREITPLEKINDHYQKFILTLDDDPEANYNGIRRANALDWLLGKN